MLRATMMDIAKESGYSIATVSRVLNRTGKYSKEAEEKILKVAGLKNYVPDLSAQGLRRQHTKSIGVIIPSMEITYYGMLGQMILDGSCGCLGAGTLAALRRRGV